MESTIVNNYSAEFNLDAILEKEAQDLNKLQSAGDKFLAFSEPITCEVDMDAVPEYTSSEEGSDDEAMMEDDDDEYCPRVIPLEQMEEDDNVSVSVEVSDDESESAAPETQVVAKSILKKKRTEGKKKQVNFSAEDALEGNQQVGKLRKKQMKKEKKRREKALSTSAGTDRDGDLDLVADNDAYDFNDF